MMTKGENVAVYKGFSIFGSPDGKFYAFNDPLGEQLERDTVRLLKLAIEAYWVEYPEA
jgi:hypothetical protein